MEQYSAQPTMDAKGIPVVVNKHNTARVASSQFGHVIVQCATDLEHLYRIYSTPTHDKHQWLLLQFIELLKMDAKGVRNM